MNTEPQKSRDVYAVVVENLIEGTWP